MWLAVLFVWGSLQPLAASDSCPESSEDASSWVRLKPLGHCRDGENMCPYRITLPPLTIQLPKPFRELEKMVRDLKSLTQTVNQLKADCRQCKERQRMEYSLRATSDEQDGETIQASRATVSTKERQQDLPKRVKAVQGTTKTEEQGTMLISSGTKQVDTTNMEQQRWNTSLESNLNPSSTRHVDEHSGGPSKSNATYIERRRESMSKVREPHIFSSGYSGKEPLPPKARLFESHLPGQQDVDQPKQPSSDTGDTKDHQLDLHKRIKVIKGTTQKTEEEEETMLISSGTKQVNPTGLEKQRWSTFQERNLNPNNSRYREETSGEPKESNPAHMERRTGSISKVREPHTFSNGELGKEMHSTKGELIESTLPGHQDEERPTQAFGGTVNTGKRQDEPKRVMVVEGTIKKTEEEKEEDEKEEEDTMFIRNSTKQVDPSSTEKQRWHPIQEKNLNPSSTKNRDETSGEPKGSTPAQIEKRTETMSKVRELLLHTAEEKGKVLPSPRVKHTESFVPGNQDEHQPTQGHSETIISRERQQDVPNRAKAVQGTIKHPYEEDTMLIHSDRKEINSTSIEKQRWNNSQVRYLNPSSTRHSEDTRRGPKESNPSNMERKTESTVKELHSLTAEKREKELQSPRAKHAESSLLGNRDEEHSGNPKTGIEKKRQGQNTSGILTVQGEIKSIPEISVVEIISEDVNTETTQPKDKAVKRFPGFPRLINTNRKEIKLNPNAQDRFKHFGDKTKVYSPVRDRPVKTFSRGSGFTPIRMRQGEETLLKADSRNGTGSGWRTPDLFTEDQSANLPEIIRNTSKIKDSKVGDERQPATSANAQNMTETTKANLDQQGEEKKKVRGTGVKVSRTSTPGDTGDPVVPTDGSVNMALYPVSENKVKKEKSNDTASYTEIKPFNQDSDAESDTKEDAIPIKTFSGSEKSSSSMSDNDPTILKHSQTWDSHSENSFSILKKAESDTDVNSSPVTPVGMISGPGKIWSSTSDSAPINVNQPNTQIWERISENPPYSATHAESGTGMDSVPLNTGEVVLGYEKSILPISGKADATVDVSLTEPQSLDNKDDLHKGQLKQDFNTTQPSSEKNSGSDPIKVETERKKLIRNKTLRTDHLRQTFTDTENKSPIKSVNRSETHAVGLKVRGRPRPSGLTPLTIEEIKPHPGNSTKNKERATELNHPDLRKVKNVTRTILNHVKQPDRTTPMRGIPVRNPKLRKPYILHSMPGNKSVATPSKVYSSGGVDNSSGLIEHVADPENRHIYSKTGLSSTNPNTEFLSSTQSVKTTVVKHTTVDQPSTEKDKIAPTVEVLKSLDNHQPQNTSQNTETKLFHVTESENPGGKRGLDPITVGVREHGVETAMNQSKSIGSLDIYSNSGPDSHRAVVEKSTEKKKGSKPFRPVRLGSIQENNKIFFRAEGVQNSKGKILPTGEKVSTDKSGLNSPTTATTTHPIKSVIMDKHSQITQPTITGVTTPHFMNQDHEEKAKAISGAKVSNTHVQHRHKYSSQEVESQMVPGTSSDSDSRDKNQDPVLKSKAGGPSKVRVSNSNLDNLPNRAKDSSPVVMDRVQSTSGPEGSTPSPNSTPPVYHEESKSQMITVASMEGNNRDSYPVAVDISGDTTRIREEILYETTTESTSEENSARLLIVNNMEERDGLENQLLSTCHGQCEPRPTPQPRLNIQRSSENYRDKPPQDCSDLIKKNPKNGVYSVTRVGSKSSTFHIFCDMEASGGGWTLIQHRFDGNTSFNRTWDDYKRGFGNLTGEFWLGNDKIHWLTSAKAMVLRIELEDLDGVKEYAQYDRFHVANESQHYRLTIGGYSGTAGNAMQFSKKFNHDQKNFTTPDRDNDGYPSGNCGAYYSSGWWFDACMAANLNGKYYQTRYKGVRNGIFWGTWHNISTEYYPTNDRQSFKTVRMMVRPRTATVRDY